MDHHKYFSFALFALIINVGLVKANTIYGINVNVTLDEEGNGKIIEKWDMNVNQGTENYKPMMNLGNSEITNFR